MVFNAKPLLLSVEVHLNGMIDDQVSWTDRVDPLWIPSQFLHCIPHGSKVHHCRDSTASKCKYCMFVLDR